MIDGLGKVTGRVRRRPIFFRQMRAEACAYAGDRDAALTALEEAAALGLIDLVWLDRCPLFEALHPDARFAQVKTGVAARAELVLEAFT
jgi:serine/threonine-protein kinase